MKLVFLVLFSTLIYACHEPASTERQSNGREDLSETPIDTILRPKDTEYWVSIDHLRSLDKKHSICDCWRQTTFHLLDIDTNALEIIIHSNLFHAGMETQETLPLIADGQMYVTDTAVAGYFREPIYFKKPNSDTLEITMKKRKYKFVRRTFMLGMNPKSKTGYDSKSMELYKQSNQLNSRILLK